MGRVFVLNRLTGAPLLPVHEEAVPKSDIPGEESSPTQPASTISLVPEKLSPEDAWGKDAQERQWCAEKIKSARSGEIFTPPSLQGTLVFPGNVGGVNWGSSAYDPQRHLLFVDTNRLPIFVKLIPRDELQKAREPMLPNPIASTANSLARPARPSACFALRCSRPPASLAILRPGAPSPLSICSQARKHGTSR